MGWNGKFCRLGRSSVQVGTEHCVGRDGEEFRFGTEKCVGWDGEEVQVGTEKSVVGLDGEVCRLGRRSV